MCYERRRRERVSGSPALEATVIKSYAETARHVPGICESSCAESAAQRPMQTDMMILFFVQPGTNSRSTLLDMASGFERAGHTVLRWELAPMWQAAQRDPARRLQVMSDFTGMVGAFIKSNRIDFSVAMWGNALVSMANVPLPGGKDFGGRNLGSIFDLLGHKHVCYWLDAPQWAAEGSAVKTLANPEGEILRSPLLHHVINNEATGREMSQVLRLPNVIAQSYGINEEVFRPRDPMPKPEFDLVFGLGPGDPPPSRLMLEQVGAEGPDTEAIRHEMAERIRPKLKAIAARWPAAIADTPALGAMLERLLKSQLTDRHTPILSRLNAMASADAEAAPAITHLLGDIPLFVDLTSLIRATETWERAFTVAYLAKRFRCALFGPGGGEALAPWGMGMGTHVAYLGNLKWEEQPLAYARGRLGLNIMRWQDDAGLNVKPYEITGSGVGCLCAHRTGVERLFDLGREILTFEGPAAAAEVAGKALSDAGRLARIAEAGCARTHRDHTWTAVAQRLVAGVIGKG